MSKIFQQDPDGEWWWVDPNEKFPQLVSNGLWNVPIATRGATEEEQRILAVMLIAGFGAESQPLGASHWREWTKLPTVELEVERFSTTQRSESNGQSHLPSTT